MCVCRPHTARGTCLIFVQLGRLQGVAKSALREESTVIGPSSALSLTVTLGETQPWCETLFSHLDKEDVSLDVLSGPFQLGCQ